jgi:hypothetical protein
MHRDLAPFPLAEAMKALTGAAPGALLITMSVGQWDGTLSAAYMSGFILLELDEHEQPVRAYRKASE